MNDAEALLNAYGDMVRQLSEQFSLLKSPTIRAEDADEGTIVTFTCIFKLPDEAQNGT